jgi:quercetin dioxygenase-like cupin family protein
MEDDKKTQTYEEFRKTASDYAEEKEAPDFLTDPAALASAREKSEHEQAVSHGAKLRSVRMSKGFTLEELSSRTGIGAKQLERLEQGETLLPLGQLIKLSKALSLKMADVISTGEEPFTIVRANQRQSFSRFGKARQSTYGYEYESLAPNKKDRLMEPFIVTLHPAEGEEPSSHDGQEFIYVLEGRMEAIVEGTKAVLEPGDAIYYDSTTLHLVKAHGDKPAKILAVLIS